VRRSYDERILPIHTAQHRPYLKRVMFWGCFGYRYGASNPVNGMMNAFQYKEILRDHLLPQLQQWDLSDEGIFQQDNAPCHKASSVMKLLNDEGVRLLEWPPYSPDLSPIENLWAIVKRKVHIEAFNCKEELIARVLDIWNNDDAVKTNCQSLIEGMPRRINACIAARGGVIKY
jgi:hypothetical protein